MINLIVNISLRLKVYKMIVYIIHCIFNILYFILLNKKTLEKILKLFLFTLSLFIIISCDDNIFGVDNDPNIVFIFADDLGYGDLGSFGATDVKTPNIDRIADEGIKFTEFYSASSVCSPSRAALLTGRMPQRFGLNGVLFPESLTGMPESEYTIAEMLKDNGYSTGMVGKWHLGHMREYMPLQQGFDFFFGIPYSNDMESTVYYRGNNLENHFPDQRSMTKKLTNEAINFIDNKKESKFFLYVAHPMPHVPLYASNKFLGTSERGIYGDVIQEIDWSVGMIINKLEEEKILDNTIIIFSSDNGPWLTMKHLGGSSGILRNGKMYTFEGGMRVPTLAMWKKQIPSGKVYDELAAQIDWLPTFSSIVNAELPDSLIIDGKDISDILFGSSINKNRDYLYFDYSRLMGYRKGDWKIKLPYEGWKGTWYKSPHEPHDTLLFNLKTDPGERNNLYKSNKEIAIDLFEMMNEKYLSMGTLPKSITLRTDADESHLKELNVNK